MCGVAGAVGVDDARAAVANMIAALDHRGPDHSEVVELVTRDGSPAGALGATRLAIMDTSRAGNQPMVSADGVCWRGGRWKPGCVSCKFIPAVGIPMTIWTGHIRPGCGPWTAQLLR